MIWDALKDPNCGWSVGTFGAVGEFVRDPDEECSVRRLSDCSEVVTARGGIRVTPRENAAVIAYETFVGDGETWGNAVAFCVPREGGSARRVITCLGPDAGALRAEDRESTLFDLGIGAGHVSMCVRTSDPELRGTLKDAEGQPLLGTSASRCSELMRRLSPARVLLSPLARIEVYAIIPAEGGKSPSGPHTHLLPKLLASGRTHSANVPIPDGLQPVLSMHPRSPWRDQQGKRVPYDPERARSFDALVRRFGIEDLKRLRIDVETAVRGKVPPADFPAPSTRQGRIQLRISLRRLTQDLGIAALRPWREAYDALESGSEDADSDRD
jgi:hypothetical protein